MSRMRLPFDLWLIPDRIAWTTAIETGDIFNRGPGGLWADATRHMVQTSYGRWLAFLAADPSALTEAPVQRLTKGRLENYIDHLAPTVGTVGRHLYVVQLRSALRVMFPG